MGVGETPFLEEISHLSAVAISLILMEQVIKEALLCRGEGNNLPGCSLLLSFICGIIFAVFSFFIF